MTRVTCKFCEAQSTSQKFTHESVSLYFPINTKNVYFYPYIYAKATNYPKKVEKCEANFPARDPCHSSENICHGFLMLHCRQMPRECKYTTLEVIFLSLHYHYYSYFIIDVFTLSMSGFSDIEIFNLDRHHLCCCWYLPMARQGST